MSDLLDGRERPGNNVFMRRMLAAQTGLAVLLAFFIAPFLHVHTAEAVEEHPHGPLAHGHGAVVHTHFPGAHAVEHDDPGEADLSTAEKHDLALSVFAVLLNEPPLWQPFLTTERLEAIPPTAVVARIVLPCAPRAHDPPARTASSPRAPPA